MLNNSKACTHQHRPVGIRSIAIAGFRCLRAVPALDLPPLSVLIGANGAGKSTLLRFFELLGRMMNAQGLQEFVLRQGGGDDQFFMGARVTARIHAQLCVETAQGRGEYRFALEHLSAGDALMVLDEAYRHLGAAPHLDTDWHHLSGVSKEAQLAQQDDPFAQSIRRVLSQCVIYQFHDTSARAAIRLRWDTSDSLCLRADGGNLAAVLLDVRDNDRPRYQVILRQIQRVLPSFKDFVLEPIAGKVELRWQGWHSDKVFGAHLTSDGSLRVFCLFTLLNLPPERLPELMFFDEPELGLHPHAMNLLAEMLKRVAQTRQVFVATQSPYLVDCFDLENIIVVECPQGETTLRSLPRDHYQAWLDDDYLLSDIWLKTPVGCAP